MTVILVLRRHRQEDRAEANLGSLIRSRSGWLIQKSPISILKKKKIKNERK